VEKKLEGNSCCRSRFICLFYCHLVKNTFTFEMWIVPWLLMLFSGSSNLYSSISVGFNKWISLKLGVNA